MERTLRLTHGYAIAAFVLLTGCVAKEYAAVDRNEIQFVELTENIRFIDRAYPAGTKFELVKLEGGLSAVFLRQYRDDLLFSAVGPLLSTNTHQGAVLDSDLCTNCQYATAMGYGLPSDGGVVQVHGDTWPDAQPVLKESGKFCFKYL